MVLLRLSSMALSRSRFALSPLAETLGSMSVLTKPCSDPWLTPWYTRHHDAFHAVLDADPFAKGLVELICSTKYLPGYVTLPPSGGMRTALADELKPVAAARDETVRADLEAAVAHSWERHDLGWLTGHGWGPGRPTCSGTRGRSTSFRTGRAAGRCWNETSATGQGCWPPTAGPAPCSR